MFNFFHNIALGISAAILAFTGAFHTQAPAPQAEIAPGQEVKANTSSSKETQTAPPITVQSKAGTSVSVKQNILTNTKTQIQTDGVTKTNSPETSLTPSADAKVEKPSTVQADPFVQAKQDKLNAINLEIANLNAQYAKDTASAGGETLYQHDAAVARITEKYTNDYNALVAQFQQIQYSK